MRALLLITDPLRIDPDLDGRLHAPFLPSPDATTPRRHDATTLAALAAFAALAALAALAFRDNPADCEPPPPRRRRPRTKRPGLAPSPPGALPARLFLFALVQEMWVWAPGIGLADWRVVG